MWIQIFGLLSIVLIFGIFSALIFKMQPDSAVMLGLVSFFVPAMNAVTGIVAYQMGKNSKEQ